MNNTNQPRSYPDKKLINQGKRQIDQNLYRGVYAEKLSNNCILPIGGSLFSDKLTTFLECDFDCFKDQIDSDYKQKLQDAFIQNKEPIIKWLSESSKEDIDPYLYFLCTIIYKKTNILLDTSKEIQLWERNLTFTSQDIKKLSDCIGQSACAERSALGQYLLQCAGIKSYYMSGITMENPFNEDDEAENHSFIIIADDSGKNNYIFDIARGFKKQELPRIYKLNHPLSLETLQNQDECLYQGTEILTGAIDRFGVGDGGYCKYRKVVDQEGNIKSTIVENHDTRISDLKNQL